MKLKMGRAKELYEKHLRKCRGEGYRSEKQMIVIIKEAALAAIEEALQEFPAFKDNPIVPLPKMPEVPIVKWLDAHRPRTYGDICPCNPSNGGSGICNCIMGNKLLDDDQPHGIQPFYHHVITVENNTISSSEFKIVRAKPEQTNES